MFKFGSKHSVLSKKKKIIALINASCSWNYCHKLFLCTSSRKGVELEGKACGWRLVEGLEPICQLFKLAERRSHPECERGWRIQEIGDFKWKPPHSNSLRSEGWGRNVDSRDLGENRHNTLFCSTSFFCGPHVEEGGRTWSSGRP